MERDMPSALLQHSIWKQCDLWLRPIFEVCSSTHVHPYSVVLRNCGDVIGCGSPLQLLQTILQLVGTSSQVHVEQGRVYVLQTCSRALAPQPQHLVLPLNRAQTWLQLHTLQLPVGQGEHAQELLPAPQRHLLDDGVQHLGGPALLLGLLSRDWGREGKGGEEINYCSVQVSKVVWWVCDEYSIETGIRPLWYEETILFDWGTEKWEGGNPKGTVIGERDSWKKELYTFLLINEN